MQVIIFVAMLWLHLSAAAAFLHFSVTLSNVPRQQLVSSFVSNHEFTPLEGQIICVTYGL